MRGSNSRRLLSKFLKTTCHRREINQEEAMSTAAVCRRYTPEEYLTLERKAEFKSEYLNGEIYAMSGARQSSRRQSHHHRGESTGGWAMSTPPI